MMKMRKKNSRNIQSRLECDWCEGMGKSIQQHFDNGQAAGNMINTRNTYLSTEMQHRCNMLAVEKYTSKLFHKSQKNCPNSHL